MKKYASSTTIIFVILFFIWIMFFTWLFVKTLTNEKQENKIIVKNQFHSHSEDNLFNPYIPPLNNEQYLFSVPINVSTNLGALDVKFRQVGILNPVKGKNEGNVLSLMGRPIFLNRDMWQYYTIGNQLNQVKLPILINKKNALNEYGVNRLFTDDIVYIEGLNDAYRVTIYENDTLRYLVI
jgi:hypothetical protein